MKRSWKNFFLFAFLPGIILLIGGLVMGGGPYLYAAGVIFCVYMLTINFLMPPHD